MDGSRRSRERRNLQGKSRCLSEPLAEAFGNPMMEERDIARFLTNSLCSPSARSRLIRTTTKMSGWEPANHGRATACRSATEFINRPMEAKPGPTLVWKNRSALLESQLPPERATLFLRPYQARSGAIHRIAVFIKRATG